MERYMQNPLAYTVAGKSANPELSDTTFFTHWLYNDVWLFFIFLGIEGTSRPEVNPYGPAVAPEEAPEAITQAVASLPPEQMFELMKQMKVKLIL